MKVTIAIDSFKGSMSSISAAEAAREGVLSVYPDAVCDIYPIADGGEGTVAALSHALGAETVRTTVHGPLGDIIEAELAYARGTQTALIEMAAASGLTLIPREKRNPLYTSTYGVGEMILRALSLGARRLIIGIGGSATNDAGAGMLMALGYSLKNGDGESISLGAVGLRDLKSIDTSTRISTLSGIEIITLTDVKNPLLGKNGASYVYGGQKGADEDMKAELDSYLSHFATLTREVIEDADPSLEGAGAAGGLGFALATYLGAELVPGIDAVINISGIRESIRGADVVLTGEGRLDGQSVMGKAPIGISTVAMEYGKPCYALAGALGDGVESLAEYGLVGAYAITPEDMPLEVAMREDVARENMKKTTRALFLSIKGA